MRVHVIKHVPFEGPGRIAAWAEARGHELTESLALTEEFPAAGNVGLVCVMGGPMDADDHIASPWLLAEKRWLSEFIDAGGTALGVCLGAQILAEILGGRVERNPQREIGWFKIALTEAGRSSRLMKAWPSEAVVGHWHGDTFALPPGLEPTVASAITRNQAFEYDGRIVGLQFHLEWDAAGLAAIVRECSDELANGGESVQTPEQLLAEAPARFGECDVMLWQLLDALCERAET